MLPIFYVPGKSGAREQYFTNLQKITHLCIDFFTFLQKILHPLFFQSVETVGDLYMDVAEACAENGIKLYKMTSLCSCIVCLTIGGVCGRTVNTSNSRSGGPGFEPRPLRCFLGTLLHFVYPHTGV